MSNRLYHDEIEVLRRAQEVIGIPLRQIDSTGRLGIGKGAIGSVLEEGWFGYAINSESEPDFAEAGVELKVTPYIRARDGIKAKERLVCNIINYMEEYNKTFITSSFFHKCHTMLIMSYEHRYGVSKGDYTIDRAILFHFPMEDLIIIEQDWEKIIRKIKDGMAHTLSEGDTLYLCACTKGAKATTVRRQPFSPIMAKQRAYALKASYMTQVLRKYAFGCVEDPRIIRDWHTLAHSSLEEYIVRKTNAYRGKTQAELKTHLEIDSRAKNINELLLAKMLDVEGKITNTREFKQAGIVPKTIRVEQSGRVKESMSFAAMDFLSLCREHVWEESVLYNMLAPTKFLFVIFMANAYNDYVFTGVVFWNIPVGDLDFVKDVWQRTANTLRQGVELRRTPYGIVNNLPKQSDNPVAHVRPHAKNSADCSPLPDGRMMTKQCFWLNNSYISKQIEASIRPMRALL